AARLEAPARLAPRAGGAGRRGRPQQGRYAVLAVAGAPRGPGAADRPPLALPAAPGAPVLWHPGPDAEFAILPLAGPPGELSALAAALDVPAGTRAGIGSAVEGLAALGDARRLAETALRACPASGGTVLLGEHLPDALV
ncbi:PucR family transcriptional regulator, partial [Streptomyces anulatus]